MPEITQAKPHAGAESAWVLRFVGLVPAGGPVLDLACGGGRHTRLFVGRGHPVTAVDRDLAGIADLTGTAGLEPVCADLEDGGPWPLPGRRFAAVVVTNYLHRPLLPRLPGLLQPGGLLIYETFAVGNEAYGRPANPDFLLRRGELLDVLRPALDIVAYEHGLVRPTTPAVVQRICAVRPDPAGPEMRPLPLAEG